MDSLQLIKTPVYNNSIETNSSELAKPEKFVSTLHYFDYLVSNPNQLQRKLQENARELDRRDDYNGNTLLHFIADNSREDLTCIVEKYLTEGRVALKNNAGQTVLDVIVSQIGTLGTHRNFGKLLGVYRKFVKREALLSLKEQRHRTQQGQPLLDTVIDNTRKRIAELKKLRSWMEKIRTYDNEKRYDRYVEVLADAKLVLAQLRSLKIRIDRLK